MHNGLYETNVYEYRVDLPYDEDYQYYREDRRDASVYQLHNEAVHSLFHLINIFHHHQEANNKERDPLA